MSRTHFCILMLLIIIMQNSRAAVIENNMFGLTSSELTFVNQFNKDKADQDRSSVEIDPEFMISTFDYSIRADIYSDSLLSITSSTNDVFSKKFILYFDDALLISLNLDDMSWGDSSKYLIYTPNRNYSIELNSPTDDFGFSFPYVKSKYLVIEVQSPLASDILTCGFTITNVFVYLDNSERVLGQIYPVICAHPDDIQQSYINSAVTLTIDGRNSSGVIVSYPSDPLEASGDVIYVLTASHNIIENINNPCNTQLFSPQDLINATAVVGKTGVLGPGANCGNLGVHEILFPPQNFPQTWRSLDVVAYDYISFSNQSCQGNDVALIKFTNKVFGGDRT